MTGEPIGTVRARLPGRVLYWTSRAGGPAVLVLLVVVFAATEPDTFLTINNIKSLLVQQAIPGILAAGVLLPLVAGEFDFSGGAVITASAVAMVELTGRGHLAWPVAWLIVIGGAGLVGVVNGLLVSVLHYNSFVATLAVGGVVEGAALVRSQGQTLYQGVPQGFLDLGRKEAFGVPLPVVYLAVVFAIVAYVLQQTAWGRHHAAIGKGREAVRLAGVPIRRHLLIAFACSSLLAGIAGTLLVANLGSAPPNVGSPYVLAAFAACFLGSTMLRPGFFNAGGTLLALLLIAVGVNGLSLAGVSSFVNEIFTGVMLILAVGVSQLEQLTR